MATQYADFFQEHNIQFSQAVIFKTVPADLKSSIDINKYDMIIFFSPSGIASLKENYPDFEQGEVAMESAPQGIKYLYSGFFKNRSNTPFGLLFLLKKIFRLRNWMYFWR